MTRARPEVSVVIPTRDRPDFLVRALEAALTQEDVDVEVVVVDDASPDPAATEAARGDSRVSLIRHEQHRGVSSARNTGVAHARAAWIAFLDDDDMWSPHKLRSLLDAVSASGADFAYSGAIVVDAELRPLGLEPAPPREELLSRLLQSDAMPGGGSNVMASASLLEQLGGFDESFSFSADWDLSIRLAVRAKGAAENEILVAYSHHPGSWVIRDDPAIDGDFRRLAEKHADTARRLGVRMDAHAFDQYVAHGLLRGGRRLAAARRYAVTAARHRNLGSLGRAGGALLGPRLIERVRQEGPTPPAWLAAYQSVGGQR